MTAAPSMVCHRHREALDFMKRIERDVPADKLVHVVLEHHAGISMVKPASASAPSSRRLCPD